MAGRNILSNCYIPDRVANAIQGTTTIGELERVLDDLGDKDILARYITSHDGADAAQCIADDMDIPVEAAQWLLTFVRPEV